MQGLRSKTRPVQQLGPFGSMQRLIASTTIEQCNSSVRRNWEEMVELTCPFIKPLNMEKYRKDKSKCHSQMVRLPMEVSCRHTSGAHLLAWHKVPLAVMAHQFVNTIGDWHSCSKDVDEWEEM